MLNYKWTLKDATFTKDKGTVFSCFACGGGSTMGYKLAGFDVLGCNEIDPKMMAAYRANHNPKYSYLEPIQTFKNRDDLPDELYNLDILDGSPPCSSFSMAGNRDKDWGKEKKFREGQAEQVLDTLFFDFIDLAKKLQPKVVVAENVKGMLVGTALEYVGKIKTEFNNAGYYVGMKLLDASTMGVPQKRERVFFYAARKDLYGGPFADLFQSEPELVLDFNEQPIPFSDIDTGETGDDMPVSVGKYWHKMGDQFGPLSLVHPKGSFFGEIKVDPSGPLCTITAQGKVWHHKYPRRLNTTEFCLGGSYPLDYDFVDNKPYYLIGMSVPPVMTAHIADAIYSQWLKGF